MVLLASGEAVLGIIFLALLLVLLSIIWLIGIVKCFVNGRWGLGIGCVFIPLMGMIFGFLSPETISKMKGLELITKEVVREPITKKIYTETLFFYKLGRDGLTTRKRIGELGSWLTKRKEIEERLITGSMDTEQLSPPPPYDKHKKWITEEINRLEELAERAYGLV